MPTANNPAMNAPDNQRAGRFTDHSGGIALADRTLGPIVRSEFIATVLCFRQEWFSKWCRQLRHSSCALDLSILSPCRGQLDEPFATGRSQTVVTRHAR